MWKFSGSMLDEFQLKETKLIPTRQSKEASCCGAITGTE